jgi:hypothetical protein
MHAESSVFDSYYIDCKSLYLQLFRRLPCVLYANEIDTAKAIVHLQESYAGEILETLQSASYNRRKERTENNRTVIVFKRGLLVEVDSSYVEIYYAKNDQAFANAMIVSLSSFVVQKEEDFEINIITQGQRGLELKAIEIQPTQLDVDLYYNDDFREVDALLRQRLGSTGDKGIVLFHGLPGTGKTTYIRYLIGSLRKKVLFVSPSVAGSLMNPEFIELLIDYPNSVLVIEDAENIIRDRRYNSESSVSNLLNLSDGLLSDFLNVQIVCTFNSALSVVDEALLRKGRLIARYEFGKLETEKARRLRSHLGLEGKVEGPMTLAEITHPGKEPEEPRKVNGIGFQVPQPAPQGKFEIKIESQWEN